MAGLNIPIGADLTNFYKGLGVLNKQLQTMSGQKLVIDVSAKIGNKDIENAAKKLIEAQKNIENLKFKKGDQLLPIQSIKDAQKALKQYKKDLKALEEYTIDASGKKVGKYTDSKEASRIVSKMASVGDWITATKGIKNAYVNSGLFDVDREKQRIKELRSSLTKEMSGLRKELDSVSGSDLESLKLKEQLLNSLIAKQQQYNKTLSRVSDTALGKVNSLRDEKSSLVAQQKKIAFQEKEAEMLRKINLLEQDRANAKTLDTKLEQLRAERVAIGKLITAWEQYRKQTKKAGGDVTAIDNKINQLRAEHLELVRLSAEERNRIAATNQRNALLNEQGKIFGRLKTLIANYLDVYAFIRFGQKIVEVTGYFEKQRVALEGILNSASEAQKMFNGLQAMALESPFQLKELVTFTKQLSAYGIEAQKLLPTVSMLADMSAGLGVDMDRLILAYGQVKAASVLRGQELRQFTEAGIPMVEELAKRFTALNGKLVTTGEVFELISKRQVSFEMVSKVLQDMTSEGGKFYKMQENITDTLYGQVEKLKDTWTIALSEIGGSGITGKLLKNVVIGLQKVVKNAKGLIFGLMTFVALKSSAYFVNTAKQLKELINIGKAGFKGISAATKFNAIFVALSAVAGILSSIISKSKQFRKELEDIDTSFAKDTAKYVQGFDNLLSKLSNMTEGTKEYNDTLETLKNNYSDYVNPSVIDQLIAERKQLDETAEGWGVLHDSIVSAIKAKKNYEKHEALKEKAGNDAAEKYKSTSLFGSNINKFLSNTAAGLRAGANGDEGIYETSKDIQYNDIVKRALGYAIDSFIAAGETEKSELENRVKESMQQYGLNKFVIQAILNSIDSLFSGLTNSEQWDKYLEENAALENDFRTKMNKRFDAARKQTAERQEGKWEEGMSYADYNPLQLLQAGQYDTSMAAYELIDGLKNEINNAFENGDTTMFGKEGTKQYEENLKKYLDASNAFYAVFANLSESSFQATGKTAELANAIEALSGALDGDFRAKVKDVLDNYKEMAGIRTARAASITTNITKDFLENDKLDKKTKDKYAKYVENTTDATVDEIRNGLVSKYQSNLKIIESFGDKQLNEENRKYVEELKREQKFLRTLAGEKYYDIELDNDKGGSKNVSLGWEFSEFINEFKDAYARYKEATQKGGVEMGLGYVRNDKQFQDMFGQFFGGKDSEAFKKLYDIKIGAGSKETLGSTLENTFITSGLENGVLDFEKAANSVYEQLMAYYEGDTEHRKSYLDAAKALKKWILDTISKDNLNKALDKLTKEMEDLTLTFEKTNKGAELYKNLLKNGTLGALGGNIPEGGVAAAYTPTSTIIKGNLDKMMSLYNEQVQEMNKSQTEGGAKAAPIAIDFGEGTLGDMYNALATIKEQISMNADNFSATALGEFGKQVEAEIVKLIDAMSQEMSGISGEQYTGNELQDTIANAKIQIGDLLGNLTMQENKARKYGMYDMNVIGNVAQQTQAKATDIFDKFIKDSRFDVIAQENFGKVDIEDIKAKFSKAIEGLPPVLKEELERKMSDLEIKVMEMNAQTGALGAFGAAASAYRNADETAKKKYDDEVARNNMIKTDLANAEKVGYTEYADQLRVQLVASDKTLKDMGDDGKNLAAQLKLAAMNAMMTNLKTAQKYLNTMSDAVTSVVDAFKSLSKSVNKVYDVLNDGENPQWMQDMDGLLEDFGENFQSLIAPVTAAIAVVIAFTIAVELLGTKVKTAMIVIVAVIAAIAALMAAFQQHDRNLENTIENLNEQIDTLDNAITNLNALAERSVGFEKMAIQLDALGQSLTQASLAAEQARLEEEKKNTDESKVEEYKQKAQELMDTYLNGIRGIRDELLSSTEDWASSMSDSIRSAFQNGENAARAFRSTVKEMLGDVIQKMLEMAILQPLIEQAMQAFTNEEYLKKKYTKTVKKKDEETGKEYEVQEFDEDGYLAELLKNISDPAAQEKFYQAMLEAGYAYQDGVNALTGIGKEAFGYNSENASLSGGIESITEDTARRLEALQNSQLGYVIRIATLLEQYLYAGSGGISSTDIQASLSLIQSDTSGIRAATQSLLSEIRQLRTTSVQPLSVKVV